MSVKKTEQGAVVSRTMYGYEVRVHAGWNDNDDRHRCSSRCVWSAEAAGQQGPSNYLATEEEAEAGREQLAWALSTNGGEEVSVEDVRVVAVDLDRVTR